MSAILHGMPAIWLNGQRIVLVARSRTLYVSGFSPQMIQLIVQVWCGTKRQSLMMEDSMLHQLLKQHALDVQIVGMSHLTVTRRVSIGGEPVTMYRPIQMLQITTEVFILKPLLAVHQQCWQKNFVMLKMSFIQLEAKNHAAFSSRSEKRVLG